MVKQRRTGCYVDKLGGVNSEVRFNQASFFMKSRQDIAHDIRLSEKNAERGLST